MVHRFHLTPEDKEKLFHAELLKSGVEHQTASRVAKLLVSGHPETALSPEEQQLMTQACRQWLAWHKQRRRISQILAQPNQEQQELRAAPLQNLKTV